MTPDSALIFKFSESSDHVGPVEMRMKLLEAGANPKEATARYRKCIQWDQGGRGRTSADIWYHLVREVQVGGESLPLDCLEAGIT